MQKFLFALSLGFAGILVAHNTAHSQTLNNCAQRGAVVERLKDRYGETVQSMGLAQNNGLVELFASTDSGTWTIVITLPNGMTCLVAAGSAYEPIEQAAVAPGEKA